MTPASALDIAQALVRLPTVNPDYDSASAGEGPAVAWLENWGRAHGFTVWRQPVLPGRENIFLQLRNGADHPHFMLNGHTDTVGSIRVLTRREPMKVDSMTSPCDVSTDQFWSKIKFPML